MRWFGGHCRSLHTRSVLSGGHLFLFFLSFFFFVFRNHITLNVGSLTLHFLKVPFGVLPANIKV